MTLEKQNLGADTHPTPYFGLKDNELCPRCKQLARNRNQATADKQRQLGRPRNGKCPPGFKIVGHKGKKRYVQLDPNAPGTPLYIGNLIIRLRDEGMTWPQIHDWIEEHEAKREGRKAQMRHQRRQWGIYRLQQAYKLAVKVRDGEPLDLVKAAANVRKR